MTEHKHAEVLRAIADGKEVQCSGANKEWRTPADPMTLNPLTYPYLEWRIKPRTPRRIWVNEYANGNAVQAAASGFVRCVEFIEVLPDE